MVEDLKIPRHIAFIMDGNGRWAKKRNLPRTMGHREGVRRIRDVAIRANELGVELITLYAFSTENWARPNEEVNYLMNLPRVFVKDYLKELNDNNIKVDCIGDIAGLPSHTQEIMEEVLTKTANNTGMILNFALNYGGQQEIVQAVQQIVANQHSAEEISTDLVASYLSTGKYQDLAYPDLLVRTSGEQRLSNFLLWQLAYSEFYFTDSYWPDFDGPALDQAILAYNKRDRRYGKV